MGRPSRSEAALLDQQDSPLIRLVHTWACRACGNRNCVFYKRTERRGDSVRGGGTEESSYCVTCRSPCFVSTRSSLCLRATNTQRFHEASQHPSSTTSNTALPPPQHGSLHINYLPPRKNQSGCNKWRLQCRISIDEFSVVCRNSLIASIK